MTSKVLLVLAGFLPMMVLAQEADIEFRSTVFVGSYVYRLDILDGNREGPVRFQIDCKSGCTAFSRYREDFIDTPLYLMQPKDGSDRTLTVWTTGSAYRIVVYRLGGAAIHKVLDRGSRTPPAISFDGKGREQLKLCTAQCAVFLWSDDKGAYIEKQAGADAR